MSECKECERLRGLLRDNAPWVHGINVAVQPPAARPSDAEIRHFITCAAIELAHARTFVASREKMHADGIEQYDMVMQSAKAISDALRAADPTDGAA